MSRIRKAIFPVAGQGTRILPATKSIPKEMLPVYDRPLIQWAVEEAIAAGIEEIILVSSRGKQAIEDHFDRNEALEQSLARSGKTRELAAIAPLLPHTAFKTIRQPMPLGLGHAVLCARDLIGDEPFAVFLPDDFCQADTPVLAQLVERWHHTGGSVIALQEVPPADTAKYGIAALAPEETRIQDLVEKPNPDEAPSNLAVIGRYVLDSEIMRGLALIQPGAGNEIQLTDAIAAQCASGSVHGHVFAGRRWDCGSRDGWLAANFEMAAQRDQGFGKMRLTSHDNNPDRG